MYVSNITGAWKYMPAIIAGGNSHEIRPARNGREPNQTNMEELFT